MSRRAGLAHGLTGHLQLDAMAVVHQGIEDCVGERGFAEIRTYPERTELE